MGRIYILAHNWMALWAISSHRKPPDKLLLPSTNLINFPTKDNINLKKIPHYTKVLKLQVNKLDKEKNKKKLFC